MTRSARRWAIGLAAVPPALLLLLAAFPWGFVAAHGDGLLSRAAGREVAIGAAHRVGLLSLHPTIALTDVRVAQPAWAGPGAMARIAEARIRVPALPLLLGRVRPEAIDLAGVHLELRRDAGGRANWEGPPGDRPRAGPPPDLSRLTVRDGTLRLVDARRHVVLSGTVRSDAAGLAADARGTLRDAPLRLAFRGGALVGRDPAAPYPAALAVRSPLVSIDARLAMAHPLDLKRMRVRLASSGRDLARFDDVVQAGLFPTQPYRLTATARRDVATWHVDRIAGVVGRTRLTARATVTDTGARTRLDAAVDAATWDFDDFASDAQRAQGRTRARAAGPRVVPDVALDLTGVRRLDGTVRLRARRLLTAPGSPFVSLDATATLDDRRMTIAPLRAVLVSGVVTGRVVDDHRAAVPRVSLDLRVDRAAIQTLVLGDDTMTGPFRARLRLTGAGATLRAALARADGKVGVAMSGGDVRRDYATFLGGDVVKSVGAAVDGAGPRVAVRCMAGTMRATGGRLTPAPLVLDTAVSRGDGSGSVDLRTEALDLRFAGRTHGSALLRSTAPVRIVGTLSRPRLDIRPPRAERDDRNGLLGRVGFFLKGLRVRGDGPRSAPAPAADCAALVRAALS